MKRGGFWLVGLLLTLTVGGVAFAEKPTIWGKVITKTATVSANTTNAVLWTPDAGNSIVLMGCLFSAASPSDVSLNGPTYGAITNTMRLQSGGIWSVGFGGFPLWRSTTADETLRYTAVTGGVFSITCSGWEESSGF